jgi:hypothetical protein
MVHVWGVLVIAFVVPAACSTFKEARERHSTFAEETVAASIDSVHNAVLEVLPQFDLIVTSDHVDAGLIEARGDWGAANEGAVVQISMRAEDEKTRVVVEAGQSSFESKERKRELAQSIMEAIVRRIEGVNSESHP